MYHLAECVFADGMPPGLQNQRKVCSCFVEDRGRLHGGGLRSAGDLARVELGLPVVVLALPRFALGNQGGDLFVLL